MGVPIYDTCANFFTNTGTYVQDYEIGHAVVVPNSSEVLSPPLPGAASWYQGIPSIALWVNLQ
ncbi:MAG: hypothetical protein HY286_08810 [Planctomycetes bacterium]|nr:hypothetical protein [Planctomycetota bacterium]